MTAMFSIVDPQYLNITVTEGLSFLHFINSLSFLVQEVIKYFFILVGIVKTIGKINKMVHLYLMSQVKFQLKFVFNEYTQNNLYMSRFICLKVIRLQFTTLKLLYTHTHTHAVIYCKDSPSWRDPHWKLNNKRNIMCITISGCLAGNFCGFLWCPSTVFKQMEQCDNWLKIHWETDSVMSQHTHCNNYH